MNKNDMFQTQKHARSIRLFSQQQNMLTGYRVAQQV